MAIWLLQRGAFQLIDLIAIGLPWQHTAPAAEAQGSAYSVEFMRPFVAQYWPTITEMQGGNLCVLCFWHGASRLKQPEL